MRNLPVINHYSAPLINFRHLLASSNNGKIHIHILRHKSVRNGFIGCRAKRHARKARRALL